MNNYIKLLRPHQWIKNIFCLTGVFFGGIYSLDLIVLSIIAFCSFCCASSAVYVMNDILDVKSDRLHPTKKFRPLASGEISEILAKFIGCILALTALLLAYYIGFFAILLIIIYLMINVLYSLKFKHVVLVDVFIISTGFMLRLLMGNSGIGIEPSRWIILCTLMITLFLGFAKRKSELMAIKDGVITRRVLNDYSHLMLDIYLSITAACSIICYSLFILIGSKFHHIWITVPFVT